MASPPRLMSHITATRRTGGPYGWLMNRLGVLRYRLLFRLLSRPRWLWGLCSVMGLFCKNAPVTRYAGVGATLSHKHTTALLKQSDDFVLADGMADRLRTGPFLMTIDWERRHGQETAAIKRGLCVHDAGRIAALGAFVAHRCAALKPP